MPEKAALTYESLFELLRLEKANEELQKLEPGFLDDLRAYLAEKAKAATAGDVDDEELERRGRQLANIRKLVRELFERREKKIVQLALNKARVEKAMIDSSVLLSQEKEFFATLVRLFLENKTNILLPILNTQLVLPELKKDELGQKGEVGQVSEDDAPAGGHKKELKKVKFLVPVPQFVGPNLELYGPFSQGEIAELPPELFAVLVEKKSVEELEQG